MHARTHACLETGTYLSVLVYACKSMWVNSCHHVHVFEYVYICLCLHIRAYSHQHVYGYTSLSTGISILISACRGAAVVIDISYIYIKVHP